MSTEKDEGGYIPAHDEDSDRDAKYHASYCIHIAHVFRGKEQRISTIGVHEIAVNGAEQNIPEQ